MQSAACKEDFKDEDNQGKKNDKDAQEKEKVKKENEDLKDKKISEYGQTLLDNNRKD